MQMVSIYHTSSDVSCSHLDGSLTGFYGTCMLHITEILEVQPIDEEVATPLTLETPTKSSGNEGSSRKKPKDSEVPAASVNDNAESARDAVAHGQSQSTDCGTGGSCDRSDDSSEREDDKSRSGNGVTDSGMCHMQMEAYSGRDASAGNTIVPGIPMVSAKTVGGTLMPTTDMINSSAAKPNANGVNTAVARPCGIGRQDEREIKREKRKQSNRESARRSRLRKQAEMEELGKEVDSLTVENTTLRSEINKLVDDSEKLRSENAALLEKLNKLQAEGGLASDKCDNDDKLHINTENLLSRVDNSISNGDHE